jgi:hypothetical protein
MCDHTESQLQFRLASEEWEFEQIHRLNYETFVEEIPQHAPNAQRRLVDPFHPQNMYAIAIRGATLVGMAALRGQRPFSLDKKLPDLGSFLPKADRICEVRLLATLKECRTGLVFRGLANLLVKHALEQEYELAIISGALKQVPLYKRLGSCRLVQSSVQPKRHTSQCTFFLRTSGCRTQLLQP